MTARLIDGAAVAREVDVETTRRLESLRKHGIRPGLAAIRVGEDPASEVYVRNKARRARELGIDATEIHFPVTASQDELAREIRRLDDDDAIDGILLQLPLPRPLDARPLLDLIDPEKDVDGFHPVNVGRLQQGRACLSPCTPAGVIRLIDSTGISIPGATAVVVGRSDIVGKPVAAMLLARHATVTTCHSRTLDLGRVIREGGIVVAAVGRAMLIDADMVAPGAVVIDVGINRVLPGDPVAGRLDDSKRATLEARGSVLVGDVDFQGVREIASWITPVPGGVGPMTIAMLMMNTVAAAERRLR